MGSFIGPSIAITGMAISGVAAIVTQVMNSRLASVQDGSFVSEMIQGNRMPDVFGQFIIDRGAVGRGRVMRPVVCSERNRNRSEYHHCVPPEIVMRPHGGQDLMCPIGTGVHALRTGLVEHSGMLGGYGNVMLLRHSDGSTSLYAHLNDRLVEKGVLVQGGYLIARSGNTSSGSGQKPTNPRQQGAPNDPRCQYFPGMPAHIHCGLYGTEATKFPAASRLTAQTLYSDLEWRVGNTNFANYLGAHGMRFVGEQSGEAVSDSGMEGLCQFYG